MKSYEEQPQEFRQRPSHLALVFFGIVAFLLADAVQSAVTWAIETVLAWNSGWEQVWLVDIPVLSDPSSPFFVSPPLESLWTRSGEIVSISFLVLGTALIYLWPTRTSLASRLYIHISTIVFVTVGSIGTLLARTDLLRDDDAISLIAAAVLIAVSLAILIATQRSMFVILQQFWTLHALSERLGLFAALQLPGIALLSLLFWLNGFTVGAFAAAIALVPLLVGTIRYSPGTIYERVTTHSVSRASVVIAMLAALSIGGSVWLFGLDMIDRERRAFTWSPQRGPALQTHEEIFRQQLRAPETLDHDPVIRWSNP